MTQTPAELTIPPAEALMQPLQFSAADLQANRQGRLGAAQRERLRRLRRRTVLIGGLGFGGFVLLATTLLFAGLQQQSLIFSVMGGATLLVNAVFVGMFARQWLRLSADLRAAQVEPLTGELERVVRAGRQISNLVVRVDGVEFALPKETFNLFRHAVPYTVYRAPRSGVLLAAEPLTNGSPPRAATSGGSSPRPASPPQCDRANPNHPA